MTRDTAPRGPYHSHTAGMSPQQAAAWFSAHAGESGGRNSDPETRYVNAGSLGTGAHDDAMSYEERERRPREYYCQGSLAGMGGKW